MSAKTEFRQELARLDGLVGSVLPGGSQRVGVLSPVGGVGKSTAAAAVLHLLDQRLVGMLTGVDFNPARGRTLASRLGLSQPQVPGRLVELAQDPSVVRYPADWAHFLDRVGRIHLLHNAGVSARAIDQTPHEHYAAVLNLFARYAELVVVDLGTSLRHPSTLAALDGMDHLVVVSDTDPASIAATDEAVAELAADGHHELIARATLVLTTTDPAVPAQRLSPATVQVLVRLIEGLGATVRVPYDKSAGAVGAINWGKLRPTTMRAYTTLTRHIIETLRAAASWPAELIPPESPGAGIAPPAAPLFEARAQALTVPGDMSEPASEHVLAQLPSWAMPAMDAGQR